MSYNCCAKINLQMSNFIFTRYLVYNINSFVTKKLTIVFYCKWFYNFFFQGLILTKPTQYHVKEDKYNVWFEYMRNHDSL